MTRSSSARWPSWTSPSTTAVRTRKETAATPRKGGTTLARARLLLMTALPVSRGERCRRFDGSETSTNKCPWIWRRSSSPHRTPMKMKPSTATFQHSSSSSAAPTRQRRHTQAAVTAAPTPTASQTSTAFSSRC
uniref:Uncharacterized protein n=1 Tax=Arundo donax TaxID=35708 RepID=A0A0A9FM65_ARUDO